MTLEIAFVLALLILMIAVFIWDKFRMDMVALAVLIVLSLSGILTPNEAIAGFSNPLVIMIAGLFVVGDALLHTGVASSVGNYLLKIGASSPLKILFILLPVVAILSALMSSTGTVALLIPIILTISRRSNISASRFLLPVAYAALIGGMLTLIGTPPNMIVNEAIAEHKFQEFSFFSFTPIGVIMLIVGMIYMLTIAQYFLPKDGKNIDKENNEYTLENLSNHYNLHHRLYKYSLKNDSPLIHNTVLGAKLRREYGATLFAIERRGRMFSNLVPVLMNTEIHPADYLWFFIEPENNEKLMDNLGLIKESVDENQIRHIQQGFGFAEILIPPSSKLLGKTLQEANFRDHYGLSAIGLRRQQEILPFDFQKTTIKENDSMLLVGSWEHIRAISNDKNIVIFNTPIEQEEAPAHLSKAKYAIAIMFALLTVMACELLDNVTAILIAAFLMIASGCISVREAYRSLNAMTLVLIAGLIPFATAMEKSGTLQFLVNGIVSIGLDHSPLIIGAIFFIATALLSQFISNTATALLMAPIAIETAIKLQFSPYPLLMMVAVAASCAFCTPIASPVNTLVLVPGNYRFIDYFRVGIGLQILSLITALITIPLFFPF